MTGDVTTLGCYTIPSTCWMQWVQYLADQEVHINSCWCSFHCVKGWNTVFTQLREVDAGAYSNTLNGGCNNCTMCTIREEKVNYEIEPCIWIGNRRHPHPLRAAVKCSKNSPCDHRRTQGGRAKGAISPSLKVRACPLCLWTPSEIGPEGPYFLFKDHAKLGL